MLIHAVDKTTRHLVATDQPFLRCNCHEQSGYALRNHTFPIVTIGPQQSLYLMLTSVLSTYSQVI